MNVLVLLAGIADTKWPLPGDLSAASLNAHRAGHEALGPFDEAALVFAFHDSWHGYSGIAFAVCTA